MLALTIALLITASLESEEPLDIAADLAVKAREVMETFGYPSALPVRSESTPSGGAALWYGENENMHLRVDATGRPWRFQIKDLSFEAADSLRAAKRAAELFGRYGFKLDPEGRWIGEITARQNPAGTQAKRDTRFWFAPFRHGYPFLTATQALIQFSEDGERVTEWAYYRSEMPTPVKPGKLISRADALRLFEKNASPLIGGKPDPANWSIKRAQNASLSAGGQARILRAWPTEPLC